VREKIIKFVRRKIKEANAKGVVIGLSGGVDSTTTLFLCVQSLGNDRILGVIMPSKINKKPQVFFHHIPAISQRIAEIKIFV